MIKFKVIRWIYKTIKKHNEDPNRYYVWRKGKRKKTVTITPLSEDDLLEREYDMRLKLNNAGWTEVREQV